jgi:hypothetical protein
MLPWPLATDDANVCVVRGELLAVGIDRPGSCAGHAADLAWSDPKAMGAARTAAATAGATYFDMTGGPGSSW